MNKITLAKVKQATAEFIKVLRFGKNDVRTASQVLPYGMDSKPVKDTVAAYSDTGNRDEQIVLGYIVESKETEEGETRVYATDAKGAEQFSIYLKKDGTCEIGGNTDNFVKYLTLSTELQSLVLSINAELVKVAAGLAGVGGAYAPTPLTIDISGAKTKDIKTA